MAAAFCPNCGLAMPAAASFCPRCGTARVGPPLSSPPIPSAPLPPPPPLAAPPVWHPPPPPPPGPPFPGSGVRPAGPHYGPPSRADHTARIAVIVLFLVVVLVVVGLLAPLPHPFTISISTSPLSGGSATLPATGGSAVTGSYTVTSGDSVLFQVQDASGRSVYSATGASGSFSFQANDAPYVVHVASGTSELVQVSGSYFAPYL